MPKRPNFLNATVEVADELFVVELQYIRTYTKNSMTYRTVSHWEEYLEDFYTMEDALDHLQYEIENDPDISGGRIRRKMVQTIELIVHEYDKDEG